MVSRTGSEAGGQAGVEAQVGRRPAFAGKIHLGINPIIVKELRSRMRGARAFATLTGVLLVLGVVSYALFQMVVATSRYSSTPLSPLIGQTLFAGLALLELLIVCGVTPSVTAGAISGERERETYEMLLATPLKPASILWGKLISALGYVILLVFAAIPMASLVFIFGGVSPRDMIKALGILLVLAVMVGVIGLFFSALFGRTGRATVASYLVVFLMLFGPGFLAVALGIIRQMEPPRWVLVPSPINALFSALAPSMSSDMGSIFYMLGGSFWFNTGQVVSQTSVPRPLYHYSLPLFGLITIVLYLLSTRLVMPAGRWKIGWKNAAVAALVLLLFLGGVGLAFWRTSDRYENFSDLVSPRTEMRDRAAAVEVMAVEVAAPAVVKALPPTPTPLPAPAAQKPASETAVDDQAAAYAAIVQHLVGENPYPDQALGLQILIASDTTDDSVAPGGLDFARGENAWLVDEIRDATTREAGELGVDLLWASPADLPPADEDSGLVLFGNIYSDEAGKLKIPAALILAGERSVNRLYTLEKQDEAWVVTGFEE